MKISRDDKGRASSVERDDRSRDSLTGEESKLFENHPTTTSNDDGVIKAKKKASVLRRGRSIESMKKDESKHKIFRILRPEANKILTDKIDKKRYSSPMHLTFKN